MNSRRMEMKIGSEGRSALFKAIEKKLLGYGVIERSAEPTASGVRFGIPEPFLDPVHGFPDLLKSPWMISFYAAGHLVAVHIDIWDEYVVILQHEFCAVHSLSEKTFRALHITNAHRVWPDARNRWRIGVDLSRHLNATGERVPLVFTTRGPSIEIRTLQSFNSERREAQEELIRRSQNAAP